MKWWWELIRMRAATVAEREACKRLDAENAALRSALGLRQGLRAAPLLASEEAAVFAAVTAETGWWRVVNDLLERQKAEEAGYALGPDGARREYCAGRAAALYDFHAGLHQLRVKAQRGEA